MRNPPHTAQTSGRAPTRRPRTGISISWLLFTLAPIMCVTFAILIPKGGFRLGPAPITWGYLGLMGIGATYFAYAVLSGQFKIQKPRILALFLLTPWVVTLALSLFILGYGEAAVVAALFLATLILPVLLMVVLGVYFDRSKNLALVLKAFRWCVFGAAAYGIALFGYVTFTGKYVTVPYVTTNGSDEKQLDQKMNRRGSLEKLISTYNNGNIYGVATLILLPLFCAVEKSVLKKSIVRFALVLTLSRTVWVGLLISEMLMFLLQGRLTLKKALGFFALVILAIALIVTMVVAMGKDISWLADRSLGNREQQFQVLDMITLLPAQAFESIQEIVYLSIINQFGLLGFLFFLIALASPFSAILFLGWKNEITKACLIGCITYLMLACLDGAFLFIPTMSFYWFVGSLAFCTNPYLSRFQATSGPTGTRPTSYRLKREAIPHAN